MGVLTFRGSSVRRMARGLVLALILGSSSCSSDDDSKISSGLFLAPVTAAPGVDTIPVMAPSLVFLGAIRPDSTPEDLQNLKADTFVLGRLSEKDQATGIVAPLDRYLVYESKTRSLLSATLCGQEPAPDCSAVKLHYNGRGFDEAQLAPQGSAISPKVPSIKLQNGWILCFDTGNRSIIAFRMDKKRVVNVDGVPTDVEFRPFGPTSSRNFGRGNGLLLSTVASAEEMLQELNTFGVLRFLEVEPNRVLVFFSTGVVHLLELGEVEAFLPFDLNVGNPDPFDCDPEAIDLCLPVTLLDGQFKQFPAGQGGFEAFITPAEIRAVTGAESANLGTFTPTCLTSCSGDSVGCGLFFAFDQPSSSFLTLEILTTGPDVTGATLELVGAILDSADQEPPPNALSLPGSPPFEITGGFCRASDPTPILLFEETTDTMLAYDSTKPLGQGLSVYLTAEAILARRDPKNTGTTDPNQGEIELVFAVADVRDNRLAFNKGSRELLSFSYTTPVVVLSLSPSELFTATGGGGNFNYIEPQTGSDDDLRVFNQQANTLLGVELEYETLPVSIKN